MDKNNVLDFLNVLNKVFKTAKGNGAVFQEKYLIFLNENWKPWPHVPENLFKKSFFVCSFKNDGSNSQKYASASENVASLIKKESGNDTSSDFTGSPLEYVFDMTDMFLCDKQSVLQKNLVHQHEPVTITEARYICSLYYSMEGIKEDSEVVKNLPLFVYCDGKDLLHIVLMGAARNQRSVVKNNGIISRKKQLPRMISVKKSHLKCFPLSFHDVEIHVYSQFDVIKSCSNEKSEILKPITEGTVSIECSSSNFCCALEKPSTDSTCFLLIQAVAGNENEGAHNRFKELKLIKALCNGIQTGEMSWWEGNDENGIIIKLQCFLDSFKLSRTTLQKKEKKSDLPDFDATFLHYVTGERDDMDFTDHLWHILQDCASYSELLSCFTFCFSELKNFPFVPYIYRTNMTTIGKMIRNMGKQPFPGLNLEGTMPLKLLLELGVEKLLKDYVMLFVGLEMVPYEFLTPYLNEIKLFKNLDSQLTDCLETTIKCLEKFHTVEELLIIFWCYLESSKTELNSFVRMALKHYATVPEVDSSYIFKFPVALCSVKHIVGKFRPVVWQASLKSGDDKYEKQTIIRFCKKEFESPEIPSVKAGSVSHAFPVYYATNGIFITDRTASS